VASSCERGSENSVPVKDGEFLKLISDFSFLRRIIPHGVGGDNIN